ncbi:MAG: oxidoreductase family protein [Cyclobacteriaceae bacterium]
MNKELQSTILQATDGDGIDRIEQVQSLWSGYGQLLKCHLKGGRQSSVIVKYIDTGKSVYQNDHPKGWQTDRSHQRKLKSYQIEGNWYSQYALQTNADCKVPRLVKKIEEQDKLILILEDLDAIGYPMRKQEITPQEATICLRWLAAFHANFLQVEAVGLWEKGSYWHLDTRPEEWSVMNDIGLKNSASVIDKQLENCTYKTIIHGDAKVANFCFKADGSAIAAVDFQYTGRGCGMKDVAYFFSSCLSSETLTNHAEALLEVYFKYLSASLKKRSLSLDIQALITEWKSLYVFAWADFYRFLDGWSPGHWKIHAYSRMMRDQCVALIQDNLMS